jgi:predicted ATP-grasp superfamily ATP-dependent carboligase
MPSHWPESLSDKRAEILVAGLSARALSGSARAAGYAPLAADLFGDLDLQAVAEVSVRLDGNLENGLELQPLLAALDSLAAGRNPMGIVCGSGFEDRPEFLESLGQRWSLFGNPAETVRRIKDAASLAKSCDRLRIPHPKWSNTPPTAANWLRKRRGGSGGLHVGANRDAAGDHYWQERVAGESISALVVGAGGAAIVLGLSAQWLDPLADAPFRYGGAVRPAALACTLAPALENAARAIVETNGLVGLNSVDFLVDGEDWHLIEVNPRPGATLDIFDDENGSLFKLHIEACRGRLPNERRLFPSAAAAAIVYARRDLPSMPEFDWPDWTADRQPPGTAITTGAPICTVLARANDPAEARQLVMDRGSTIRADLEPD